MRPSLLTLAGISSILAIVVTAIHEVDNPGAVRAELAVVTPRVAAGAVPSVARVAAISEHDRVGSILDAAAIRADIALDALGGQVLDQSHSDALRLAFRAYYNFRAANPDQVRKPYLYFVDYGLDSRVPRGYIFDMQALQVVEGPFPVAHGRGSSTSRDGVPTSFSNREGSAATSLGLYVAQETYAFSGTSAGQRYRSVGLRLRGVSGTYNNAARERGVVVHGAPYVTAQQAGRSEGCPAMEQDRASRLIPMIANGGMIFLFSPLNTTWMQNDPWASGSAARVALARVDVEQES